MTKAPRAEGAPAYLRPRVLTVGLLGIVSGLPYLLTASTLTTWLRDAGVGLEMIGLFSLVQLPYTFKFVWSPLLDRFRIPVLGRRRGWIVLWQIAVTAALFAMGLIDPAASPGALFALACAVAAFSASLDIVVDAYRTDTLADDERGPGAALFVTGYRVALIAAGAGALVLADAIGWRLVYWGCGGAMFVTILFTLRAPEPGGAARPPATLHAAVVEPMRDFLSRERGVVILAFVLLYKLGEGLAGHLTHPFLLDVGFSKGEIGALNKGIGMPVAIAGTLLGGLLVVRLGALRSLLAFGVLQAAPNLLYIALAHTGPERLLLAGVVGIDQLCGGLATAAFVAYLMGLCDRRYSAFQYALLSSASSVLGRLVGGASGAMAVAMGWPGFFAITAAAAVPALLVLRFVPDPARSGPPPRPDR